jgi:hypothetical protein
MRGVADVRRRCSDYHLLCGREEHREVQRTPFCGLSKSQRLQEGDGSGTRRAVVEGE